LAIPQEWRIINSRLCGYSAASLHAKFGQRTIESPGGTE
jgi:hypothetical protein